ncbi:TIGR03000 domain-containing protein [Blastopirellula marina]|uniref:TIGR03000 domain-containing protein n=1 Tax=Blastopirellula marina TaxID=124 RepID=A0A2S8G9P7_9BACT|nr:TIGR03000 domain-containing protein [Blastopirellula marina]PQO41030.1 hypothetical protein C5Y98_03440 [Blastopirellula marina]PTL45906.1 TIGR03000 domain-containing protein [Blastopirellula marina]
MRSFQLTVCCVIGVMFSGIARGQMPRADQQGGTYNAPAGANASTPFKPQGMPRPPFSTPSQTLPSTLPQNGLNRDILVPGTPTWLQRLQLESRNPEPPQKLPTKVTITVKLPAADSQLSVNEHATKQNGQNRIFITPDLEPGTYRYQLEATWQAHGRPIRAVRTITFEPGANLTVDFTQTTKAPR